MRVNALEYYSALQWETIKTESLKHDTPCLVIDLDIVRQKYAELGKFFPFSKIYYAVKANPAPQILSLLNELGANFDIASRYELDLALSLGIEPERISYGNTIKKRADIRYFYEKGVTHQRKSP